MEMKPTLQICIGNWTQNDAQVESIMMKMKKTSIIFSNSLFIPQKVLFQKEPHQNVLKFLSISFQNHLA